MEDKHYPEEIDLQKYWLVLRRRWLVIASIMAGTIGLAAYSGYSKKPIFQAQGRLLFQSDRTSSLTGVGEKIGSLESLKRESSPLDTQAVVVQSTPVLENVIKTLKLKDKQGKLLSPEDIRLKVEPIVGTDVLKLSYEGEDAKQAAAIINQVMKVYIAKNIEGNREEAVAAGNFIDKQLPAARAEMDAAASALQNFRTRNKIIELEKETTAAVASMTTLGDQANQVHAQLAEITTQEATLQGQVRLPVEAIPDATALSQLPSVQLAFADLQKVQSQLAIARTRYRDEHPEVAQLKRQEIALNEQLQNRAGDVLGRSITVLPSDLQMSTLEQKLAADYLQLRVQRVGLEQKLKTITRLRTLYRDRADDIPVLSQKQTELEQRYTLAKKTYENLVNRLQDIKVVESQTIGNARVVQKAIAPKVPTGNMRSLLLAGGGVVGLMLGMSAAFLVDLIDRSLKSVKEAQTVYGYALLGLIPRFKPFDPGGVSDLYLNGVSPRVIVATGPRSIIHESYRMLQANLKFTSLDRKVRSIVVTSSVAGVGKSEVAANLAATFAQSGKKVLLIDGDLRAPSQHHLWGVINSIGLSNALVDPEDLPNAFHTVTDRLTILTAGVMPPDPLSLLDSEAMNQLLKACSEQFDYVILDSPPLVGMADAAVLGKIADGVLLVIRPEVETTTTATAAKMLLERSNSRVLGMVANGVNTRQEPDSSFYYSGGAIESYGKVPAYKRLKSKV